MNPVTPRELHTTARVADALVYAAGVAGIVAGGLLFRDGEAGFAVVAWALAFVAGAALRLAAWSTRALAQLLVRTEGIAEAVDDLRRRDVGGGIGGGPGHEPPGAGGGERPQNPWGGWH